MPIDPKFDVQTMTKDCFHKIDYQVMRHAFDIQNEFGRLYDESIYQTELVGRCEENGFPVVREGEIVVTHETFCKSYFIDTLINGGAVYEHKAVEALNGFHESQLLNYMFLLGLSEGKLINFAPPSVQHRFVSTTVTALDRYSYVVMDEAWDANCESGERVRGIIKDLLADWGAYLDIGLYKEAILHLLGDEGQLLQPVDIVKNGQAVGYQKFTMLNTDTMLYLSSVTHNIQMYQKQLVKLLAHVKLKRIHWVNFSRQRIILTTLKK